VRILYTDTYIYANQCPLGPAGLITNLVSILLVIVGHRRPYFFFRRSPANLELGPIYGAISNIYSWFYSRYRARRLGFPGRGIVNHFECKGALVIDITSSPLAMTDDPAISAVLFHQDHPEWRVYSPTEEVVNCVTHGAATAVSVWLTVGLIRRLGRNIEPPFLGDHHLRCVAVLRVRRVCAVPWLLSAPGEAHSAVRGPRQNFPDDRRVLQAVRLWAGSGIHVLIFAWVTAFFGIVGKLFFFEWFLKISLPYFLGMGSDIRRRRHGQDLPTSRNHLPGSRGGSASPLDADSSLGTRRTATSSSTSASSSVAPRDCHNRLTQHCLSCSAASDRSSQRGVGRTRSLGYGPVRTIFACAPKIYTRAPVRVIAVRNLDGQFMHSRPCARSTTTRRTSTIGEFALENSFVIKTDAKKSRRRCR
jgi:hypothetical protein